MHSSSLLLWIFMHNSRILCLCNKRTLLPDWLPVKVLKAFIFSQITAAVGIVWSNLLLLWCNRTQKVINSAKSYGMWYPRLSPLNAFGLLCAKSYKINSIVILVPVYRITVWMKQKSCSDFTMNYLLIGYDVYNVNYTWKVFCKYIKDDDRVSNLQVRFAHILPCYVVN